MTKDKNVQGQLEIENLKDEDIQLWADHFGADMPVEPEELERIAKLAVNLGDITALVTYLDRLSKAEAMQNMSMLVERLSVMEYIINDKLGVSSEEIAEYAQRYQQDVEDFKAEMKKLQEEQAKAEAADTKPDLKLVDDKE